MRFSSRKQPSVMFRWFCSWTALILPITLIISVAPAHSQQEEEFKTTRSLQTAEEEFGEMDGPWQDTEDKEEQQSSMTNSRILPLDDDSILTAVHDWVTNSNSNPQYDSPYGHISTWDTSAITDMSHLFTHARFFDADLSHWNVSQVTDMSYMFAFCSSFQSTNTNLQHWDTSHVQSMKFMFHQATQFTGEGLQQWNVARVTDMTYFAQGASSLQPNLWHWDTRSVRSFNRAFHNATQFTGPLCWQLHPQAVAMQTFCGSNGAHFTCDPGHTLDSEINRQWHDCCDCGDYDHTLYDNYHYSDGSSSSFWDDTDNVHDRPDNNSEATTTNNNQKMGVILASCIWAMVIVMMVVVGAVMIKRRHVLRRFFFRDHHKNHHADSMTSSDGTAAAIATLVGHREDTLPATTITTPDNTEDNIPMVMATTTDQTIPPDLLLLPTTTEAFPTPWNTATHVDLLSAQPANVVTVYDSTPTNTAATTTATMAAAVDSHHGPQPPMTQIQHQPQQPPV
ncbi:protein kinase kinase kinase [Seminavis robusta]|uniref:Protein kinase kinase kinase n=1 Tax=Seminavis robusta TaxID=568900 RepID=A0A9N8EUE2_9STRA|nr:protein kinase kinase kinase [Seminavis robusta]|eukprot:Sro1601_g285190.1 protein kinase kinase kinase (508) ;mRNA; f:18090-19613